MNDIPPFEPMIRGDIPSISSGTNPTEQSASSVQLIRSIQDRFLNQQVLSSADVKTLVQELSNKQLSSTFKEQIISMLTKLKHSALDSVVMDLLAILQHELGGDMSDQYLYLIPLIEKLDALVKDSMHPEPAKAFQTILGNHANTVSDARLSITIQQLLSHLTASETQTLQPTLASEQAPFSAQTPDFVDEEIHSTTMGSVPATIPGLTETFQGSALPGVPTENPNAQALSVLNNAKTALQQLSGILQISKVMPTFIILPIASQLLVNIGAMLTAENPHKIAIVTDYVASLLEYDRLDYIRKVNIADDLNYEIYEHYRQLYEDGYRFIISLHLNKNLRTTYQSAMAAKRHMDDQNIKGLDIHVHNTNANGVGLGLMIYELIGAIKANQQPLEVNHLAMQLVQRYKHWVCPLAYDFVKHHQWVMDLADNQKKIQMRLFHFIPIIELDKKLTIVSVSHSKETALAVLIETVCKEVSRHRKITRICVEYKGVYRDAIKVRNQIKVRFPSVKVSIQSVGSLTIRYFGPQLVGICII